MARFCEIEQGTRAVKVIDMPLANVPHGIQQDSPEQQHARELHPQAYRTLRVGVRALLPFERERVLELAGLRAVTKGGKAEELNPLYEHAKAIYTVAAAAVDPDWGHPEQDPPLFFAPIGQEYSLEAAAETIRNSRHITDDIVLYLRERQEMWQDQINPRANSIADNELWDITKKAVENEDFLAESCRPGLVVRLANIMAGQVLSLLGDRLLSGSTAEPSTTIQ